MDLLIVALVVSSVVTSVLLVATVAMFRNASREEDSRIRELRNAAISADRRALRRAELGPSPFPGW